MGRPTSMASSVAVPEAISTHVTRRHDLLACAVYEASRPSDGALACRLRLETARRRRGCGHGARRMHGRSHTAGRAVAPPREKPAPGGPTSLTRLPGNSPTTVVVAEAQACGAPARAGRSRRESGRQTDARQNSPEHRIGFQEGDLKRQQAQHVVAGIAQGLHPPLAPRPDARADVLHGAECLQTRNCAADAQVEVRGINADESSRPLVREQPCRQNALDAPQAAAGAARPRRAP